MTTKFPELENKTFYKITNETECHNGFQYKDGLNILTEPFSETGSCVPGGFYFTDIEHILEFLDYGIYVRIIELPLSDPEFKCVKDEQNKWRSNRIIFKNKMSLKDATTLEYLIKQGANNYYAFRYAAENGKIDRSGEQSTKRASRCHLEVIKFLVEQGANIRADNDYAVRWASENGKIDRSSEQSTKRA